MRKVFVVVIHDQGYLLLLVHDLVNLCFCQSSIRCNIFKNCHVFSENFFRANRKVTIATGPTV